MSETKPCEGCGGLIHLGHRRPAFFRQQRFCSARCYADARARTAAGHRLLPIPQTWTAERVAELSRLWSEGVSSAEVGRQLGLTKNAVVGKAHRMALPPRDNPVKHRREPEPYVAPIVEAPAPLAGACLYPMWGNNEKPDHTYCGEPRKPGRPYCSDHCEITHVPITTTRGKRMLSSIDKAAEYAAPPKEEAA
jgi:GcrA cell cycle regulator